MFRRLSNIIVLILIIVCGTAISTLFGLFFYKAEEKSINSEFSNDVDKQVTSLYREIMVNLETVRTISILFNGDSIPSQQLFKREAARLVERHKEIQALEWIPRVAHSERHQYESEIRREFPDFVFTERQTQGQMTAAKKRDEYFPVYYVEPLIGNEAAFGFDLASSAARRKALIQSRDNGIPLATASISLVQEQNNQKGFLAFLPVYEGFPTTVEKRRERLKGFVLGVFRIGDVFLKSEHEDHDSNLIMNLIDGTSSEKEDLLYTNNSHNDNSGYGEMTYIKKLPEIWGRQWFIQAIPKATYIAAKRSYLPMVIFGSGFSFAVAIVIYIYIISNREVVIRNEVIQKTKELKEVNERLEQVSRTDGLTKIANRRHLDEYLEKVWLMAIRETSSVSFILLDIDFFKLYNDNYGHPKGDECLRQIAAKLQGLIRRPADLIARYGGEEFAIILPDTSNPELVANSCRQAIEELQIPHDFSETTNMVTISLGVCTVNPAQNTDPNVIIKAADTALYKAKESGRNRVEIGTVGNE